jgi:hypothetical protein
LSEVLKLRRNSARSVLRVNLSQVQKLRRNSAFAHREIVERSRKSRNPLRFHNRQSSGGTSVLRIQVGAKDTGFAAKAKAEAFETLEIFQGEGRSASSGGSIATIGSGRG